MPSPPSGTVTFLFTDIEGSTKLWELHPEPMRGALAQHDALLRQGIEQNQGSIVNTLGDGVMAAFHTAGDAVRAVLQAQLAMSREVWPEPVTIRVRMGLHTGAAEFRDGDYFGPALNRAARLMAAGHGGQVLLSDVTQELCQDCLPERASLLPQGEHRLKDLNRPETIFQLRHPDLPADFPPLKSLANIDAPKPTDNIPLQATSFIGREQEVAAIKALLGTTRLLTLTGSGGCGKTRLSLQAGSELLDRFSDGVWLIELASLSDPASVTRAAATVVGLTEVAGKPLIQTLTDHLAKRRLLLILDNCEHLLDACSQFADTILRQCPTVTLLASSRESLGIAGETTYRVPSLSLPDPKLVHTAESLSRYDSVRLFVERAVQVQTGFRVTDANAPALASICQRLDGIPLAIELAAARVRSMSVEEVNRRLDQRFRLLTGGSRTALPRQQTLRSLIDWSYDLLTEVEKALLRRLSVFAGGWTVESAESVCTGGLVEDWEVLDLLTSLVDKSLAATEEHGGATRYHLLETIRQYARDRLVESCEGETWRSRHFAHFLAFAESTTPGVFGNDAAGPIALIEAEYDNLRAALTWACDGEEDAEGALRLCAAIGRFWTLKDRYEGRGWCEAALAKSSGSESPALRARVLSTAGALAMRQTDFLASRAYYDESLAIRRERGDRAGIARCLSNLSWIDQETGDLASAIQLQEECLSLRKELGDRNEIAWSLAAMGGIALLQKDLARARSLMEEALALNRECDHTRGIWYVTLNLGVVAIEQGEADEARRYIEEYYALATEQALLTGRGAADFLSVCGGLALLESNPERAARLFDAGAQVRDEHGLPLTPAADGLFDEWTRAARQVLGDEAFAAEWAHGHALGLEEALSESMRKLPSEAIRS